MCLEDGIPNCCLDWLTCDTFYKHIWCFWFADKFYQFNSVFLRVCSLTAQASIRCYNRLLCRAFSLLYLKLGDIDKFYAKCAGNPLTTNLQNEGGLRAIKRLLSSPKKTPKSDSRVTGSELIDSSLQEILGYIVRDYVQPWYHLISVDSEFPQTTVRQTAQTFAINISNR